LIFYIQDLIEAYFVSRVLVGVEARILTIIAAELYIPVVARPLHHRAPLSPSIDFKNRANSIGCRFSERSLHENANARATRNRSIFSTCFYNMFRHDMNVPLFELVRQNFFIGGDRV
jgi:hypothetical protein